jgi:hypothetical protein
MADHAENRGLLETLDQVRRLLESDPVRANASALGAPCLVAAMDQFAARDRDVRRQLVASLHALRELAGQDQPRAGSEGGQDG